MSTVKSPFEIRLGVLELAFNILLEEKYSKNKGKFDDKDVDDFEVEDVIAVAEKLNEFISKRK